MEKFTFERLDAWGVALEALASVQEIVAGLPRSYGELAEQLRRASLSIVANLAEGIGKEGRDRLRFHRIALGSAYETAALVEAAARLRVMSAEQHLGARQLLLREVAMLSRLAR